MEKLAINKETIDVLTDLGHKIIASQSDLRHNTHSLKSSFNRERENLGEFEEDVMNILDKVDKVMEEYQNVTNNIPNRLFDIANRIAEILEKKMHV